MISALARGGINKVSRALRCFTAGSTFKPPTLKDSYDVVVIGGGTGGITCAKESMAQGLSTALLDNVTPSPRGSTWGLGGTCTNVGCVPKKLMHTSGIIRHHMKISPYYGWVLPEGEESKVKLSWEDLTSNIQGYIKSANFSSVNKLKELGIDYVNARGTISDPNTINYLFKNDSKYPSHQVKAKNIVVAVGSRPNLYYDGAGKENPSEFWVTSDDLFTLEEEPGPTLVYGGGYIGVECAGFLRDLGYDVTLLSLFPFLANFDTDLSAMVMADLKEKGVVVHDGAKIESLKKLGGGGMTEVEYSYAGGGKAKGTFKTMLLAVGRSPSTKSLGLAESGIQVSKSGHVVGRSEEKERASLQNNVYAVGDCLYGCPQLMPVAQKSGHLVARRIAARMQGRLSEDEILKQYSMDYENIPTTLFTPSECASVGFTEEDAVWRFGYDNVEIYHSRLPGLEDYILPQKSMSYMKVITNKKEKERVVGMHFVGAHAGEIMTAFAVGVKRGITKRDLDFTVGVHPSTCEEFMNLKVKKREQPQFTKTSC